MAVDQMIQKVQDALKLSNLRSKLPREPKVVDIRVEDYVDTDGEDALRVMVVLDERGGRREGERARTYGELKRTSFVAASASWASSCGPYILIAKQSELDEDDDEE